MEAKAKIKETEALLLKRDLNFQEIIYRNSLRDLKCCHILEMQELVWDVGSDTEHASNFLIKKLQPLGLSIIKMLTLKQHSSSKCFKKIMKSSFIKKICELTVVLDKDRSKAFACNFRSIMKLIPTVKDKFVLYHCNISKNHFRKLIQAGRHILNIVFINCEISMMELELSDSLHYSTKSIILEFWKDPLSSESCEQSIKDLLKAMAKTDLNKALEILKINSSTPLQDPTEYAQELGFHKLSINYQQI
ncbi:unnamed protein product [Moneuplotes crassus]|uniref:Uncharacterized protein n=1 Tax=Euplotes crassus TaxID=5936 RepID=A0AAD1XUB9_EUPCR|nr:unnamed protein product [Moneuplotes crassus]